MALMRPMHPTWNRSSAFSPRLAKRWITERTSRRLPAISSSRAFMSPCLARSRRAWVSSFFRTFSFDVFTPQISTLFCICWNLLP